MLEGAERRASMCDTHYVNFLYSRGAYRFSQQQFSCAQRARRKFRMEPVRNCGKICQRVTFCYVPLFLWFQMLIR